MNAKANTITEESAAAELAAAAHEVFAAATGKPRSEAAGIVKRSSSYFADPKTITRREGFNPRFDFGEIDDLMQSIKVNSILNPLRVKRIPAGDERLANGFVFELIDGDRRLTAVEKLLKGSFTLPEGVPVIIVDKAQTEIQDLVQMFVANEGKPFLPLEEAAAYDRMRKAGMSVKQICLAVGRKQMHVTEILALANADESVKQAVKDGKIGKTMAKQIATHARGDKAKQAELAAEAVAAGKDKGKRRAVIRKVDDSRRAKAAKKGKVLKMRALSDEELSALGAKIADRMPKLIMDAAVMMHKEHLDRWISKDDKLAVAFTYGALQALKAAAGLKVKLEV